MNKQLKKLLCIILTFLLTLGNVQYASATDLCVQKDVAFIFFNGVQTTEVKAQVAVKEFERLHGTTSPTGDEIGYEYMYNYSNGFEDFVETFEQRLLEQNGLLAGRFELFFEALKGDGPWWSSIISSVNGVGGILNGLID